VNLQAIASPAVRAKAEIELAKVKSVFNPYEIRVAGSELLQAFFDEVIKDRKVKVVFVNDANYSVAAAYALPVGLRKAFLASLFKAKAGTDSSNVADPNPSPMYYYCYPANGANCYTYGPAQRQRMFSRLFARRGCR